MESEWKQGIWIGHPRDTPESLVGTDHGVVRAYTIKRLPEDERWNKEKIKSMQGNPQQPDTGRPGQKIPIRVGFDPVEDEEPEESKPARQELGVRRLRIIQKVLDKH